MPQTPQEAAQTLRNAQGFGGFDPVQLASLRGARRDEALDRTARGVDPQRNAFESNVLLRDMNEDPFTGADEHARIDKISNTLSDAALEQSPEMGDLAKTRAQRNAFGAFLGKRAGYEADISQEGDTALDAASQRKINEADAGMSSFERSLALRDDASRRKLNEPIAPQAQERNSMQALSDVRKLAPTLLRRLEEQNPGIDTDPSKYGGAWDTVAAKAKRYAYDKGLYTRDEDIGQMEQLLRVIAARPYMAGRPNQTVYNDIMSHLGEFGFSPGADYARIKQILAMVPELEQGVIEGAQPLPRLDPASMQRGTGDVPPAGLPPGVTVTRR